MRQWYRIGPIGLLAAAMIFALESSRGTAQPIAGTAQARPHVYLLRGLMNIFSLGMDSLAEELSKRGVYATVSNHSEWQSLADQAASAYKARKEDPIILIGHSLGADAVMQMAAYLNRKNIPVALVVPFDGTELFSTSRERWPPGELDPAEIRLHAPWVWLSRLARQCRCEWRPEYRPYQH